MSTAKKFDDDMFRSLFNAIPSFAFVVDDDVRIQEYNTAASELLSDERAAVLNRRGGEALHCLHANEVPEGCGHAPFCKNCVIRNSVNEAFQDTHVVRRRTTLEILSNGKKLEVFALITAAPFHYQQHQLLVLLIIEDISELTELKRLIPICCICKKVRDDKESWIRFEAYFKDKLDVSFSHGYCPECFKNESAKLRENR
jgi:PAS domain-containing protein